VKNIKSIYIGATGTTIRNAQDHAKWAVTVSSKKPTEDTGNWICLGDINRQPHQLERGGGTMCIKDQKLWQSFYNLVQRVEECSRTDYTFVTTHLFKRLWTLIGVVQFFYA
ncbi:unnamed protein product, partial [Schistosoma margrebowiei]